MVTKMNRELITNEMEFKNWFEKNFENIGYSKIIKDNKGKFPDFIMLKNKKEVGVELETSASNFILHRHNPKKVDEIVCIIKDTAINVPIIEATQLQYKSRIRRVSATIDPETKKIIDLLVKSGKYRNKSHVIEKAIEMLAKEDKNEK